MIFRVTGMDRDTGVQKTLLLEGQNQQDALDAAFDQNVVVEKIEEVKQAKSKPVRKSKVVAKTEPVEGQQEQQAMPVSWFKITEYNWRSAYNRQVSIIAMGVMIGMFLFSCIGSTALYVIGSMISRPSW